MQQANPKSNTQISKHKTKPKAKRSKHNLISKPQNKGVTPIHQHVTTSVKQKYKQRKHPPNKTIQTIQTKITQPATQTKYLNAQKSKSINK